MCNFENSFLRSLHIILLFEILLVFLSFYFVCQAGWLVVEGHTLLGQLRFRGRWVRLLGLSRLFLEVKVISIVLIVGQRRLAWRTFYSFRRWLYRFTLKYLCSLFLKLNRLPLRVLLWYFRLLRKLQFIPFLHNLISLPFFLLQFLLHLFQIKFHFPQLLFF